MNWIEDILPFSTPQEVEDIKLPEIIKSQVQLFRRSKLIKSNFFVPNNDEFLSAMNQKGFYDKVDLIETFPDLKKVRNITNLPKRIDKDLIRITKPIVGIEVNAGINKLSQTKKFNNLMKIFIADERLSRYISEKNLDSALSNMKKKIDIIEVRFNTEGLIFKDDLKDPEYKKMILQMNTVIDRELEKIGVSKETFVFTTMANRIINSSALIYLNKLPTDIITNNIFGSTTSNPMILIPKIERDIKEYKWVGNVEKGFDKILRKIADKFYTTEINRIMKDDKQRKSMLDSINTLNKTQLSTIETYLKRMKNVKDGEDIFKGIKSKQKSIYTNIFKTLFPLLISGGALSAVLTASIITVLSIAIKTRKKLLKKDKK